MSRSHQAILALLVLVSLTGCAKQYVVTQPLETTGTQPFLLAIGEINDGLPLDTPSEEHPRPEELQKLSQYLRSELDKKDLLAANASTLQVQGTLVTFKRGSGAVRFFVGFGLGTAKATVNLRVVDTATGAILFAGNFSGTVSSWAEAGDQMFRRVAKDFAKELTQQMRTRAEIAGRP